MARVSEFEGPVAPKFGEQSLNVRDHGATGDGRGVNTSAFAQAIRQCAETGGGTIIVPRGVWLTGPIHLRSGVRLHLEAGAEVRFSREFNDYLPPVFIQRGGVRCYNYSPMLYARDCHDIAITGEGTFHGQGEAWWSWKHTQPGMDRLIALAAAGVPPEQRVFGTIEAGVRPPMLQMINCRHVLIEGVRFVDSPSWTVHPCWCDHLTVRHVSVKNPVDAPNTDGINFDACRHALMEHCNVESGGDNAICLKAGRDADAWDVGVPCEDVVIRHCRIGDAGGLAIGSEMSAGVRNARIHDCVFDGARLGVRIKSKPGRGGFIRDIDFDRLVMRRIQRSAIGISLFYQARTPTGELREPIRDVPEIERIAFRDVQCDMAERSIEFEGLATHPLKSISLSNIDIVANQPMTCRNVLNLNMHDVAVRD